MPSRIRIIQRIEHDLKLLVPIDVELRFLDIGVICFNLHILVESAGALLCDLFAPSSAEAHMVP